jgi:septum formation protein
MINDEMINLPKLILASQSPRRAEILRSVGWGFEKKAADVDETEFEGEKPDDYVKRLAKEKAVAVAETVESGLILGSDTTVVINKQIIGKPADLEDARRMLRILSGNWHEVLTGVALVGKEGEKGREGEGELSEPPGVAGGLQIVTGFERTRVKFARLSDKEIEFLVQKGDPLDKAGAYAVQAQAALFIEGIEGDYWNVVGLPVNLVYRLWQNISAK